MKENNNIDNLFKEGVKQDFPFDENLWAAMEEQLPVATPKRSLWHFNLNSVILGVMLFIYASIQTDTAKSSRVYSQIIDSTDTPIIVSTAAVAQLNRKELTNNGTLYTESENYSPINNSRKQDESTIIVQETQVANAIKNNSEANAEISEEMTPNNHTKAHNSFDVNEKQPAIKSTLMPSAETSNNKRNIVQNPIIKKEASHSILLSSTDDDIAMNDLSMNTNEMFNLLQDEELPPLASMLPAGFNHGSNKIASPKKGEEKQRILPKKKQYYLEFEAGRSFDLEKKVKSTNSQFEDLKKQTENSLHSVNLGVNVLTHYKFLTFGVGLHYNRFYENVNYTLNKEANTFDITYDTNYVIVDQNFNSNGNPVILIREEVTEIKTTRTIIVEDQLRVQNEFKRIRIPLSVGYEKAFGSWSAGLSTSFVINYLFRQDGVYINEDLNSINDFNKEEEFYLLVFGHQASAGIGYSLNEFIAIGARYNYEYDLNSFTRNYSSKFQNQNLGLWLRIRPR